MKKILTIINYILVIIAVVVSFYMVITRDKEVGLILKDASIIITITLPYIIEKVFRKKIAITLKTTYIIFIFLAQFIGVTLELYNHLAYYDKFTHWLSGVGTALVALIILDLFNMYDNKKILFNIIYMIAVTLMVATFWELFEYIANIFFGGDAQRVELTGVNDTMQDIIVAFLGSILVSFIYFYEESKNKKGFIRSFMEGIK
jgi:Predicted membrane protein (DUF2238).